MKVTVRLPESVVPGCPVRSILDRVGDKWTALVISNVASAEPLRFSELKRRVSGISQRMLTQTLRGLERDGVLLRTVYPTIPPKVEYTLTELGLSLVDPIQALVVWTLDHRSQIVAAREDYDQRQIRPGMRGPRGA